MKKIYNLVGLARKAGRLAIGNGAVEKAIKNGKLKLIIYASDASESTIRAIEKAAPRVSYIICSTKDEWGEVLQRRPVAVFGILDEHFARGIQKYDQEEKDKA